MADTMVLFPTPPTIDSGLHITTSTALPRPGSFTNFVVPLPSASPSSPAAANSSSSAASRSSPLRVGSSPQMLSNSNFRTWQHIREPLFGKNLSVVIVEERKFLIGVQIAKLLKRETFNLYRSLKVKGIEIVRAVSEQVEYLMRVNAVKRGTRSVTLIAYEPTIDFVEHEFQRIQKNDSSARRDRFESVDDSDSDAAPPAESRKRSSAYSSSTSGDRADIKRSRSSSGSDPEEYTGDLPEPWEILLSLAHGRFFK